MTLETGLYVINSVEYKRPVGRPDAEDRSLLPKAVRVLPQGTDAPTVRYKFHIPNCSGCDRAACAAPRRED